MLFKTYYNTLVLGLAFTIGGLIFLLIAAQRTNLTCQHAEPQYTNCVIQSDWLGYFPQPPRSADGVQTAQVTDSCDSDGCTYRVELTTAYGSVPLTYAYSSGYDEKAKVANRVNAFLGDSSQPELAIRTSFGLGWFVLIPLLFVLIGLAALATFVARIILKVLGWQR